METSCEDNWFLQLHVMVITCVSPALEVSMAFRQPALVSRQFNSPIKLYSQENVAETLNKQAQILANGALGWPDTVMNPSTLGKTTVDS
uniref:Zasp-like motif domain-containing protein n=1 Tax=Timema tahoe TaxID=61484 RepID=A0A7R9IS71_9NEOP|nr:unnamed protein product [Timema tahoe]